MEQIKKVFQEHGVFCSVIPTKLGKSGKMSDVEKLSMESDFAPPMEYSWYDVIKILKENGLEIKNSKQ